MTKNTTQGRRDRRQRQIQRMVVERDIMRKGLDLCSNMVKEMLKSDKHSSTLRNMQQVIATTKDAAMRAGKEEE